MKSNSKLSTTTAPEVDVSILIANYNARARLERCLAAIYANPPRRTFEVLVIDDGSRDGSAEMVTGAFPQVSLLVNQENQGCSRSNNRGIVESRGRFIYILNNDAELLPGAVDALADFLENHPEAGAAGSVLYNGDGSLQAAVKSLPSARSPIFGARSFVARWFPNNRFTRRELLHWLAQSGEPFQAGYVSSASIMIPRGVFALIGDFDPRLFYFDDADFCKRVWDSGKRVYCVPRARAVHFAHEGGSMVGRRERLWAVYRFHHDAYVYYRKHAKNSPWHHKPMAVLLGLSTRFICSFLWQMLKEVFRGGAPLSQAGSEPLLLPDVESNRLSGTTGQIFKTGKESRS